MEKMIFKTINVKKKEKIVRQNPPLSNMCHNFHTKKNISPKQKEGFKKFVFLENEHLTTQLQKRNKEKI